MPSNAMRSWNERATATASWPVIASSTRRTFKRLDRVADAHELVHQRLVDLEPTRGVDDHDVAAVGRCALETLARRGDGIRRVGAVNRQLDLAAELLELVDRGGTLEVRGDEARRLLLVPSQMERELGRRRRLARALEAAEEDDGRGAPEHELRVGRAHQLGQLLVDDLHDLLARVEPLEDILAEGTLPHGVHELLHDLEVDIRLEQRESDLARGAGDGLLVEPGAAAEVAEGVLQAGGECVEHGCERYRAPFERPRA